MGFVVYFSTSAAGAEGTERTAAQLPFDAQRKNQPRGLVFLCRFIDHEKSARRVTLQNIIIAYFSRAYKPERLQYIGVFVGQLRSIARASEHLKHHKDALPFQRNVHELIDEYNVSWPPLLRFLMREAI